MVHYASGFFLINIIWIGIFSIFWRKETGNIKTGIFFIIWKNGHYQNGHFLEKMKNGHFPNGHFLKISYRNGHFSDFQTGKKKPMLWEHNWIPVSYWFRELWRRMLDWRIHSSKSLVSSRGILLMMDSSSLLQTITFSGVLPSISTLPWLSMKINSFVNNQKTKI